MGKQGRGPGQESFHRCKHLGQHGEVSARQAQWANPRDVRKEGLGLAKERETIKHLQVGKTHKGNLSSSSLSGLASSGTQPGESPLAGLRDLWGQGGQSQGGDQAGSEFFRPQRFLQLPSSS